MSTILYYSNFCENCKSILADIAKSPIKDDMHFICIDKRTRGENGATYVVLETGQKVLLPPTVTKVPALLLLNRGHQVIFGDEIKNHVMPKIDAQRAHAVHDSGEPSAFALGGGGGFGVASDNYSFLDQSADELAAKGEGGMRQQHHYAGVSYNDNIETPPDNYSADTIGSVSMDQLQQQRSADISSQKR
jgi:hypothetical protein